MFSDLLKTTMLLCGTCVSPFFGANRAYTLEGMASEFQISILFNLNARLNKLTEMSLPIVSPYVISHDTEFEVWYTEKKPTAETLDVIPWYEVCARKAPRRLFVKTPIVVLPPLAGKVNLELKISCFTPKARSFWLLFVNVTIGEFFVQVTIHPKVKEFKEPLVLNPLNTEGMDCTCLNVRSSTVEPLKESVVKIAKKSFLSPESWNMLLSPTCPCKAVLKIPSRNHDLWAALKHMFELTLDSSEREFWSTHLETNIGLKLVQWMVGDDVDSVTEEIHHIYQTAITYNVNCPSEYLSMPSTIDVPDVRLYTTVDLPVHISAQAPDTFVTKLTLIADHKKETRIYKLVYSKLDETVDS